MIYDERVLETGDFVKRLRSKKSLQKKILMGLQLPELATRVEKHFGYERNGIKRRSRNKSVAATRGVAICPFGSFGILERMWEEF